MNLGFKSKLMRSLFARIRCAVESYVESYVESSMELRCKRRFEYVQVVPFSPYSTGLRALFRYYQVVMQPTMITLPSFPYLFGLKRPVQTISFFLITSDLNRQFGATSASLRIEDRASTKPLCSQAFHTINHAVANAKPTKNKNSAMLPPVEPSASARPY